MVKKEFRARKKNFQKEKQKPDGLKDWKEEKEFSKASSNKSPIPIKKVFLVIIAFLIVISLLLVPISNIIHFNLTGRTYPESANFMLQREIEMSNRLKEQEMSYNLTLPVPQNITERNIQTIHEMRVEPQSSIYYEKGTYWTYWNRSLDGGEIDQILVEYEAETTTVQWDYSKEDSGTIDNIPEDIVKRYEGDQWELDQDRNDDGRTDMMIEPSHPEIKEKAEEITSGKETVYEKSKALYEWIDENTEYDRGEPSEKPKHAYWVLESGKGDCDELSNLYASMSRAVGIPAWLELGVLHDRMRNTWGGHGWIRTLHVAENGQTEWVNIDLANDQFYFRDAHRFTTWVDDGEEGNLEDFYRYLEHWAEVKNLGEVESILDLRDDFENVRMESDGRVRHPEYISIPGFNMYIAIPALLIGYKIYRHKKEH